MRIRLWIPSWKSKPLRGLDGRVEEAESSEMKPIAEISRAGGAGVEKRASFWWCRGTRLRRLGRRSKMGKLAHRVVPRLLLGQVSPYKSYEYLIRDTKFHPMIGYRARSPFRVSLPGSCSANIGAFGTVESLSVPKFLDDPVRPFRAKRSYSAGASGGTSESAIAFATPGRARIPGLDGYGKKAHLRRLRCGRGLSLAGIPLSRRPSSNMKNFLQRRGYFHPVFHSKTRCLLLEWLSGRKAETRIGSNSRRGRRLFHGPRRCRVDARQRVWVATRSARSRSSSSANARSWARS